MVKNYAFLGKKGFKQLIMLFFFLFSCIVIEKTLNYSYLVTQKSVQEGEMTLWHRYLTIGFISSVFSIVCTLLIIFSQMWIVKVQKINFFRAFDGVIQTGKKEICLRKFNYENARVSTVVESAQAVISLIYTLVIMQIVDMTVPQTIGAISVLALGIVCGIRRGQLQQKADNVGANIQTRQELLSNSFMISTNVLEERLHEIEGNYWKQITMQLVKNLVRFLPEAIKVTCFVALMWNIADANITGGTPYSYSYIIFTAYGYIVSFANDIGNIVEDVTKMIKYSRDKELRELIKEESERIELQEEQKSNVELSESGLKVKKGFTANVKHTERPDSWYDISRDLVISRGTMVQLDGENETGKSRFNRLIKDLIPETILYDSKTAISTTLWENFSINGNVDFQLVRKLAAGLGIARRIPESKTEFFEAKITKQLNSADLQRLITLQMLYVAQKTHEHFPDKPQLLIFDEILSNVSDQNSEIVVSFIRDMISKTGSCAIIVSHTHKEAVRRCVSKIWFMRNKGEKIEIAEQNI